MSSFPSLGEIEDTRTALKGWLRQTPCVEYKPGELASDSGLNSSLVFKLELFQVTGTFKARGALAVMLSLSPQERARGVTAVSAGNHAVAVAFAARTLGISARIVMIKTANPARVQLAKSYGAQLELAEDGPSAFRRAARSKRRKAGSSYTRSKGRVLCSVRGRWGWSSSSRPGHSMR